jgi:hypothetical protein
VVTAPQASAREFFFGDGRCGGSQSTIYAGVVPDDASRVELHYLLRDAGGRETTAEVVRPMSRPRRDRHVYARTIHANNDDLPGYGRFAEGRLLYYVVVTDSRGVTTRGETYGEQKGSEIRVARCGEVRIRRLRAGAASMGRSVGSGLSPPSGNWTLRA